MVHMCLRVQSTASGSGIPPLHKGGTRIGTQNQAPRPSPPSQQQQSQTPPDVQQVGRSASCDHCHLGHAAAALVVLRVCYVARLLCSFAQSARSATLGRCRLRMARCTPACSTRRRCLCLPVRCRIRWLCQVLASECRSSSGWLRQICDHPHASKMLRFNGYQSDLC